MLKAFSIGIGNERPTGKGKNRKSAGKDEESAIITLVLSYRPATARGQQGCHCCLSGGHRTRELLAN